LEGRAFDFSFFSAPPKLVGISLLFYLDIATRLIHVDPAQHVATAEKFKTPTPRNPPGIGHPKVQNRLKAFATRGNHPF